MDPDCDDGTTPAPAARFAAKFGSVLGDTFDATPEIPDGAGVTNAPVDGLTTAPDGVVVFPEKVVWLVASACGVVPGIGVVAGVTGEKGAVCMVDPEFPAAPVRELTRDSYC